MGAWGDDDKGAESGSAYIFVRSGTAWTQEVKLTAADGAAFDYFGYSVSVTDGGTALIGEGARYDDDRVPDSGSAYVYVRVAAGSWSQQTKLTAADGAAGDLFGLSVAVSGDTTVIGAWGDDVGKGAAYVFGGPPVTRHINMTPVYLLLLKK